MISIEESYGPAEVKGPEKRLNSQKDETHEGDGVLWIN